MEPKYIGWLPLVTGTRDTDRGMQETKDDKVFLMLPLSISS